MKSKLSKEARYIKRPSKRKLRALVKEEKSASKEYKKYGYNRLSRDELRHSKFLKKQIKK